MKLIIGPCVSEGGNWLFDTFTEIRTCIREAGFCERFLREDVLFKASFDKANRTSGASFRGAPIDETLDAFKRWREEGYHVITDIHTVEQAVAFEDAVDAYQIPAFLCRQTDLVEAAVRSGKPVNIKKGQFLSPVEGIRVYEKAWNAASEINRDQLWLCERGASFGYNRLVVDIPGIGRMHKAEIPIIFDCTHSVQLPGAEGDHSGGEREYVIPLAHAVAATGYVDGFFMEVHPDPQNAQSDAATQLTIDDRLSTFLEELYMTWQRAKRR
jgi:2-dehydro-3-deoxyphosphooctonate aldolase (KDO 8-P synthase)